MPTAAPEPFGVPVSFETSPVVSPEPTLFDWHLDRTAEEWKAVAMRFARMWSAQNRYLLVDPVFVHWLSDNLTDTKIFRLDDPVLWHKYVEYLDAR